MGAQIMFTILSMVFGFVSSGLPHVLSYFQDKADKAQELELFKLQLDVQKIQLNAQIQMLDMKEMSDEQLALYNQPAPRSNFMEAYASSVRPSIAYLIILIYSASKIPLVYLQFVEIDTYITIFNSEDYMIIAAVISYFFGSRSFAKIKGV